LPFLAASNWDRGITAIAGSTSTCCSCTLVALGHTSSSWRSKRLRQPVAHRVQRGRPSRPSLRIEEVHVQLAGIPLESIATLPWGLWTPAECPLCVSGVPFED
jgi:hypothetical protein